MYDLAHKYCFCLDSDPQNAQKAFLLLFELENYVNGAITQTARIERTRSSIVKRLKREMDSTKDYRYAKQSIKRDFSLTRLHCDYHFYFICVGQIGKFLKRLCGVLNDPDLNEVYSRFEEKFNKEIRNNLEHLDERAVGKRFGRDIGHISDFGNFPGDRFSFNGKEFRLCPNSPVKTPGLDTSGVKHSTLPPALFQSFGSAHQKPLASIVLFQTRCQGAS